MGNVDIVLLDSYWLFVKEVLVMKIICISGKAGHGKDYTANLLKEELEARGYSVLITHNADLLKYICKTFLGWNGEKTKKDGNYCNTLAQMYSVTIAPTIG